MAGFVPQDPEIQVTSTSATFTPIPSAQIPSMQAQSTQQALAPPSTAVQLSEAQELQTEETRQQENISKRTKRMAKAMKRTSAEMKRAWQQGDLAATKTALAEEAIKEVEKLAKTAKNITTVEAAREAVEKTERALQTIRAIDEAATQTAAATKKAAEAAEKAVRRAKRARTLIAVRPSKEEAGILEAKAEEEAALAVTVAIAAEKARERARRARQVAHAERTAAYQAAESSEASQSSRSSEKSRSSESSGRGTGRVASGAAQLRLVPTQDTGTGHSSMGRLETLAQPKDRNLGLTHLRTVSPGLSNRSDKTASSAGDDAVPMETTPTSHRAHASPTSTTENRQRSRRATPSSSAQAPPRAMRDTDARSGEGSHARPATRQTRALPAEVVRDIRQASKGASHDSHQAVSEARKRAISPVSTVEGPTTEEATGSQDRTGGRRRDLLQRDLPKHSERRALFKNEPYIEAITRLHSMLRIKKSRGAKVGAAMDVLERKWKDFNSCPRSEWEGRLSPRIRSQHPQCVPDIQKNLAADKTLLHKRTVCEKKLEDLLQVDPEDAETNRHIYHYSRTIKKLSKDMIMEARKKLEIPTRDEISRVEASAATLSGDEDENLNRSKVSTFFIKLPTILPSIFLLSISLYFPP
jgi:hypothetical protein